MHLHTSAYPQLIQYTVALGTRVPMFLKRTGSHLGIALLFATILASWHSSIKEMIKDVC